MYVLASWKNFDPFDSLILRTHSSNWFLSISFFLLFTHFEIWLTGFFVFSRILYVTSSFALVLLVCLLLCWIFFSCLFHSFYLSLGFFEKKKRVKRKKLNPSIEQEVNQSRTLFFFSILLRVSKASSLLITNDSWQFKSHILLLSDSFWSKLFFFFTLF